MTNTNWDKGFWRGILREEDGTPSLARTGTAALLGAAIAWVTYVVIKTHVIPELAVLGTFLTTNVMSLYGVNKGVTAVKAAFDKFSGNTASTTPPQA